MTNTETAKATARPWKMDAHGGYCIENESGEIIVCQLHDMCPEQTVFERRPSEQRENMRLIVKAVNHHDELVEALLYVRDNLVRDPFDNATEPNADVIDRVNAALAKVSQ